MSTPASPPPGSVVSVDTEEPGVVELGLLPGALVGGDVAVVLGVTCVIPPIGGAVVVVELLVVLEPPGAVVLEATVVVDVVLAELVVVVESGVWATPLGAVNPTTVTAESSAATSATERRRRGMVGAG